MMIATLALVPRVITLTRRLDILVGDFSLSFLHSQATDVEEWQHAGRYYEEMAGVREPERNDVFSPMPYRENQWQ